MTTEDKADKHTCLMKINNTKLVTAIEYINLINSIPFIKLDFSELFDAKIDLTDSEKLDLFWIHERKTNMEIISIMLNNK